MRRHLSRALVGGCLLVAVATADEAAPKSKIDAAAVADKLDVYRDDVGKYYVAPRAGAFGGEAKDYRDWVFYGDGKAMHQQRIIGYSLMQGEYEWIVWSPRVHKIAGASLILKSGQLALGCSAKETRALTQLPAADAKRFVESASFKGPLHLRVASVLARDDDGVYYYVDMLRREAGGKGYRLFTGRKGAMKELAMIDVVVDKGGEIFTTKTGALKLTGDKAVWQQGKGKTKTTTELVTLELEPNRYVIYRELGIYGELGTVCEDQ